MEQFEATPIEAAFPVNPAWDGMAIGLDDRNGSTPAGRRPSENATDTGALQDLRVDTYAQVLHDEPLQLVIAAMLHLDGVPAQYRLPAVTRSVDLLERAVERQRHLVHAMGTAAAGDGLAAVVLRDADAVLLGRDIRIEVTGERDVRLPGPVERAARDILFAALTDIRRRHRVAVIRLDLRTAEERVVLTLSDDGHGRRPPAPHPVPPPGLVDLRAHAARFGGTVETGPDATLTLTLPLAGSADAAPSGT